MFGLMKNLIKDYAAPGNAVKLSELHAGCTVGFGFMPQKNISGKRIAVSEVNSYLFDKDNFAAYRLKNDSTDINVIVADDDDPTGTYLALSQPVPANLFASLFIKAPNDWFAFKPNDALKVTLPESGNLQGWLAPRYSVAVKTTGRFLEGDYRLRKSGDRTHLAKPFEYVLLVDAENEHALEAEKYENGTLRIYATVYRPITDIGEIAREQKPASVPLITSPEPIMQPNKSRLSPSIDKIAHVSPAEPDKTIVTPQAPKPVNKIPETMPAKAAVSSPTLIAQTDTPPVHSKFGRIQPAVQSQPLLNSDVLTCDLKLAGKLIDEAQRNQILLAELVRKVIDLPARVNEQVLIPFALDHAEVAELARRYNLPNDANAVKQHIIDELKRFVGEKV